MKLARLILRDPLTDLGGSKVLAASDDMTLDYEAGVVTVRRIKLDTEWLIPMGNVSGMQAAPKVAPKK